MRRLIALPLALAGCAGTPEPAPPIALPVEVAAASHVAAIEVRSAFYNPRDAFQEIFEAEVAAALSSCAAGPRPLRLVAWIHDVDRSGSLLAPDARMTRLPGTVELVDERGRVLGRYRIAPSLPTPEGGLEARRRAASAAFGRQLCDAAFPPAG